MNRYSLAREFQRIQDEVSEAMQRMKKQQAKLDTLVAQPPSEASNMYVSIYKNIIEIHKSEIERNIRRLRDLHNVHYHSHLPQAAIEE